MKTSVTSIVIIVMLASAGGAGQAAVVLLGDPTLNYTGNHDGWNSNMVVQQGQNPAAGFWCSHTNTSGGIETVTPQDWSYAVAGNIHSTSAYGQTRVTPFVVKVLNSNLNAANSMQTLAIGTTRLYGADLDFYNPGVYTQPFDGGSFTLAPGETMAIGFIDADPNGTNSHDAVLREGDPSGQNMGNNNIWYNGGGADNDFHGRAPDPVGKTFGGSENANINRNYQYNISFDVDSSRAPVGRLSALPGGTVAGAAYIEDTTTGQPSGDPLTWEVEVLSMQVAPGLNTQWHDNVGNVGLGGLDGVFAGPPSIPVFQSDQVAFGPTFGFPPEVVAAGMGAGARQRTVRFSGEIFIPESGTYLFKDGVDQTTRLIIDGQTIIADSDWSNFDGAGGGGGGSLIQSATFTVAPGGEWLPFEFAMSEDCCGDHAALYWDYFDTDNNFPTARSQAANLNDLVPPSQFRSVALTVVDSLTGTTEIGGAAFDGVFDDGLGNTLTIPVGVPTQVRLSINGNLMVDTMLTADPVVIPEPMTMLAVGLSIAGLGGYVRKRRRG